MVRTPPTGSYNGINKTITMKKIHLFESFVNEKFKFSGSCTSPLCGTFIPKLEKVGDLVQNQQTSQDLIKIQKEINDLMKMINTEIRDSAGSANAEELDWKKAPVAPVFILNLKDKYPQDEKKYYDLWYKAANRLEKFSYGGAIAIFKTYAKREETKVMLEEHDYGHDESITD